MRRALAIVIFFSLVGLPAFGRDKDVIGSWEGESKCMVQNSPCHDEHILVQITEDKKDPFQLSMDAYKIIDGAPDFMGTLTCRYESKAGALSCTSSNKDNDDWEFHVTGDSMAGRLLMDAGKTVYRRMMLRRSPK